eukprot:NODE_4290_length_796_cov_34.279522_g4267_i0.p2 GENE.NODE_4290_length_796_cov_34.279522_g4267_i0~~NODE_4290_length_796_cov_34.279522_g4267_i0.p2  ORF type:complete len:228 (-),score=73.12 NODE_4290_length_796_cov_34.279522_g4267_i0:111-719(-)
MDVVQGCVEGFWREVRTAYVPLCGDGPIVELLVNKGVAVTGTEIAPSGVEMLMARWPDVKFTTTEVDGGFVHVSDSDKVQLTIRQVDFFAYKPEEEFDFVYDRGSMVAVPPETRSDYASIIRGALRPGGWLFLDCFDKTDAPDLIDKGPPFHVPDDELAAAYGDAWTTVKAWRTEPMDAPFEGCYLKRFVFRKPTAKADKKD